ERLADGALGRGLVDLEEAAGLRPQAAPGLEPPSDEHDLACVRDREGRRDEARVHVDDVAARLADEPVTLLTRHGPQLEAAAADAAVVEGGGEPRRWAPAGWKVRRAPVRTT